MYSDDSVQDKVPRVINVKKLCDVIINDVTYHAPIFFKIDDLRDWLEIFDKHEQRVEEILGKMETLKREQQLRKRIQQSRQTAGMDTGLYQRQKQI